MDPKFSSYLDVRSKLKTGDIVLYSSHNGIGDRLIKWWSKSPYSHVGMVYRLGKRIFLLEAAAMGGVRLVPMSLRIPDLAVSMKAEWNEAASDASFENMMKPYSFIDAIRAGFGLRYKYKGYICTEYVALIAKAYGYHFLEDAQLPSDFFRILVEIDQLPHTFISVPEF